MSTPVRPPQPLTSAERTALYKTLTNPVRRRILHYIGYYGMANSTAVARALGESTGTTSYHLRKLADLHLIEEVPERSAGRERWWRLLPFEHTAASPADQTAAERDALQEWSSQRLAADIELYIKGLAEYDGPQGWVQGQRHGCFLTREELLSFAATTWHSLAGTATRKRTRPRGPGPWPCASWPSRSRRTRPPARRQVTPSPRSPDDHRCPEVRPSPPRTRARLAPQGPPQPNRTREAP